VIARLMRCLDVLLICFAAAMFGISR